MKRFIAIAVLAAVPLGGCYGRFPLTHAVYQFNGGIGNGILRNIVFWAFCILPIYGGAALIDAVIFNLIEFWGGGGGDMRVDNLPDGSQMELTRLDANTVRLRHLKGGAVLDDVTLERMGDFAAQVRDANGVRRTVEALPDGTMRVSDGASGRTVARTELAALMQAASEGQLAQAFAGEDCGLAVAAR